MMKKLGIAFAIIRHILYRLALILFLAGSFDYPVYSHYLICIFIGLIGVSDSMITSCRSSVHQKVIIVMYILMAIYDLVSAFSWLHTSDAMFTFNLICFASSISCIGMSLLSGKFEKEIPVIVQLSAFFMFLIAFVLWAFITNTLFRNVLSIILCALSVLLLGGLMIFLGVKRTVHRTQESSLSITQ